MSEGNFPATGEFPSVTLQQTQNLSHKLKKA
jgi:hypothetical protein